jgi:hypothetical protein
MVLLKKRLAKAGWTKEFNKLFQVNVGRGVFKGISEKEMACLSLYHYGLCMKKK